MRRDSQELYPFPVEFAESESDTKKINSFGTQCYYFLLLLQRASSKLSLRIIVFCLLLYFGFYILCDINRLDRILSKKVVCMEPYQRYDMFHPRHTVTSNVLMHVVSQIPIVSSAERQAEYFDVLLHNTNHPSVAAVHILSEPETHIELSRLLKELKAPENKIFLIAHEGRLTYRNAVEYANRHLQGKVVYLSTADIMIGEGFESLNPYFLKDTVFAPTRYEDNSPECAPPGKRAGYCDCRTYDGCHDSFIFLAPLKDALLSDERIDFRMGGTWGGENQFMFELARANYTIINSCTHMILYHHHCSQLRPTQGPRLINQANFRVPPACAFIPDSRRAMIVSSCKNGELIC